MTPRSDPPWWAYIQWGAVFLSAATTILLLWGALWWWRTFGL